MTEKERNGFIDGYVSTDAQEMTTLLGEINFIDEDYDLKRSRLVFGSRFLRYPHSAFEIECGDIPLEAALEVRAIIGFMAMSRFRFPVQNALGSKEVGDILIMLEREKQHVALIAGVHEEVYVRLAEGYKLL